jgi:putative membrane protein
MNEGEIYKIDRPNPNLMKLYVVRAALSGPAAILALPLLYFRYHSMRYRFDEHGVTMRWGVLMRREIHLTYARIQDIHLVSGPIQRYLGLADLLVQTASGSVGAEMVIEGLLEFEAVRDFLYSKMRGVHPGEASAAHEPARAAVPRQPVSAGLGASLAQIREELRAGREALERMADRKEAR